MTRKIRITICKEDTFDFQDLIDEIKEDPKDAFDLCDVYDNDGLTYESFVNFDSLAQEDKDKLIEALASAKSSADADFTEEQDEKFEAFLEVFEEEV
jgi:hypothetical protein